MSQGIHECQLDDLLGADVSDLVARQRSDFDRRIAACGEKYVLFGAGDLGKAALRGLRTSGLEPLGFVDNNPRLWNTYVDRVKVVSPQEAAASFDNKAIFVVTVYTSQPVWGQLRSLGTTPVSFAALAWRYPDAFLPYYSVDLPHSLFTHADDVRSAFTLWSDDASRAEYLAQLRWRTTLDPSCMPPHLPQREMYFPTDLVAPNSSESFVDCGAFDGDTVREFIQRTNSVFRKIIAIEPDPMNCQAMASYIASAPHDIRSRFLSLQSALGSDRKRVHFDAGGTVASAIGGGSYEVDCAPLDDLVLEHGPSFIKMDIEGAETDALKGAAGSIQQFKPVLFVCLYHRQEHLWEVPLLIHSLSPDYSLFLRRYSDECWELACLAVPAHRLKTV